MSYPLSATKLQLFDRCPQAFYFRYECRLNKVTMFGGAAQLGTALHKALAQFYWNWDYSESYPSMSWIEECWNSCGTDLTPKQQQEGLEMLQDYYAAFVVDRQMTKPLAVEGRIQASILVESVEFIISGRYDRLDWLEEGLALIDYKSSQNLPTLDPQEVDMQLGLYALALQQRYQQALKQMTLIHLRTGQMFEFQAGEVQIQQVRAKLSELAVKLRDGEIWEARPGEYCNRCAYTTHCSAVTDAPEPLPEQARSVRKLQLSLTL
ncbi:RecB family exonuclease [Leptolyngbya sp. AN03gr2]|uniref:RecB family exonuclease n=1 Tax=unclassified Leptolyngbya TaxID=2650499 RepID=UPI003D3188D8